MYRTKIPLNISQCQTDFEIHFVYTYKITDLQWSGRQCDDQSRSSSQLPLRTGQLPWRAFARYGHRSFCCAFVLFRLFANVGKNILTDKFWFSVSLCDIANLNSFKCKLFGSICFSTKKTP